MKEIECPSCAEMIPEDSKFCDRCGIELLECVNCGTLGTDTFCPECGKPMLARKSAAGGPKEEPVGGQAPCDKTVGGPRRREIVLKARKTGSLLRPEEDAVIGRKEGPYAGLLSDCDLISRSHGKFIRRGRDWYIVDFGSTNGTYVNDRELPQDIPVKITAGDVVDIGTYLFDVIER